MQFVNVGQALEQGRNVCVEDHVTVRIRRFNSRQGRCAQQRIAESPEPGDRHVEQSTGAQRGLGYMSRRVKSPERAQALYTRCRPPFRVLERKFSPEGSSDFSGSMMTRRLQYMSRAQASIRPGLSSWLPGISEPGRYDPTVISLEGVADAARSSPVPAVGARPPRFEDIEGTPWA